MEPSVLKLIFAVILGGMAAKVSSLPGPLDFTEGPCDLVPITPVQAKRATVDSFKYISSGNKYAMYVMSASLPNYADVREDEFYYRACFSRNTTTLRDSIATVFGYGEREMMTFNVRGNPPGLYIDVDPSDPAVFESLGSVLETITLTDHKTFAFAYICIPKLNLRSWNVFTLNPNIDDQTRNIIEAHALSLGFKKENFVFLRYDSCNKEEGSSYLG